MNPVGIEQTLAYLTESLLAKIERLQMRSKTPKSEIEGLKKQANLGLKALCEAGFDFNHHSYRNLPRVVEWLKKASQIYVKCAHHYSRNGLCDHCGVTVIE